jgi:Ca2+-transporting ATPase
VAAGIAVVARETSDAVVIFVVVLLNAVIGALQEGRAERSLAALRRLAGHHGRVLRSGQEQVIEAKDVVPGDILLLGAGDAVSADARLVDGAALQIAEATLTGESLPVAKDVRPVVADAPLADRRNMVYAGTHVTAGRARGVVVATGLATEVGRIATLAASAEEPRTPLERRIDQFGRHVIVAAVVVFVVVIALGLWRGMAFVPMFMIGVGTLVGMIPEGLPVAMTIALAVGVQRMARRRALVRRLSAVETLGSTTVICADKTGTLTRNELTVTSIYLADGRALTVSGAGYVPVGGLLDADGRERGVEDDEALRRILEAAILCNDAQLRGPDDADPGWKPVGDPTEVALLTVAIKAGIVPDELRSRWRRRAEIPFDADARMMATQHDSPEGSFVVVKGAPEAVLGLCAAAEGEGGPGGPGGGARSAFLAAAEAMGARALRVLAVAVVPRAEIDGRLGFAGFRGRATMLGLLGQIDPPRPEVGQAVTRCQAAGIRPVMVTGDHKATGLAIARALGIAREGDVAVDGRELDQMSDEALRDGIEAISVFARVHPAQKLRIVEAYQKRDEVVAMTGDGVNDAPALMKADVGVAMGITGTEVAKDAARIVIADDDFATIVAAVEEGRVVYRNIKKAILLLFSTGSAEIAVLVLAMLVGHAPPFAAVQILWNNLVTEGVIVVNLILEPAEGDEMRQRPIPPDEPLLTRTLLTRMAFMTPAIVVSTLGWFVARTAAGLPEAQVRTETFTLLAVCEWFNVLNCRSERRSALSLGLFRNPWLLGGLVVGNLLQVAVVFWAPLGRVLHTVPFDLETVVLLGVVGSLVLWVEEIRKFVVRRREAPAS